MNTKSESMASYKIYLGRRPAFNFGRLESSLTGLLLILPAVGISFMPFISFGQNAERYYFDGKDSTFGYYLAVRPGSSQIKGTLVLLTSFWSPENLLPETKLQNVAYANEILTVIAPMKQKLYADSFAVDRLNFILKDIVRRFSANTSSFALAGFGEAGNIALRYTEFTYEYPGKFPIQPKAVFGINSAVDLIGLWHWSENQIRKNYFQGSVSDARYYLDTMTKENGTIYKNEERYRFLSPFTKGVQGPGNEKYLKDVAVRLYFDTDIAWQLKNRRNSYYDTYIPDGSEMISQLLISGNEKAEFVSSKLPGTRSNGLRNPNSLSIVDEVDCIQWLKKSLDIFDPNSWIPPYELLIPAGWGVERFSLPPDFAPEIRFKGVEDIRFMPGWGEIKSEEHWSYCFLWWLEGKPVIDASILESHLKAYYSGLVARNIISGNIPLARQVPTNASIKKFRTSPGDMETLGGTISMLDYHSLEPMVLNCQIHVKIIASANKSAIYFEVSPKPLSHPVWQRLNEIGEGFRIK